MSEAKKELFVVRVYNKKRDEYIEHLIRAGSKKDALASIAEVRKATADEVEALLTAAQ